MGRRGNREKKWPKKVTIWPKICFWRWKGRKSKGTFNSPFFKSSYWGPFSGLKIHDFIKRSQTFPSVILCPRSFLDFWHPWQPWVWVCSDLKQIWVIPLTVHIFWQMRPGIKTKSNKKMAALSIYILSLWFHCFLPPKNVF